MSGEHARYRGDWSFVDLSILAFAIHKWFERDGVARPRKSDSRHRAADTHAVLFSVRPWPVEVAEFWDVYYPQVLAKTEEVSGWRGGLCASERAAEFLMFVVMRNARQWYRRWRKRGKNPEERFLGCVLADRRGIGVKTELSRNLVHAPAVISGIRCDGKTAAFENFDDRGYEVAGQADDGVIQRALVEALSPKQQRVVRLNMGFPPARAAWSEKRIGKHMHLLVSDVEATLSQAIESLRTWFDRRNPPPCAAARAA